ncbi:MAG TPA: FAD-binding oxidoreductase [Casimicrobiaceae bacterium]|nr:FAD-binding oxidoreductase [Casimicrobiaceae bacterium]
MITRRDFVGAAVALAALPVSARTARPVVNDVSRLNPVEVAATRRPRTTEEVQAAIRAWSGAISIGGGRFSQGGQIAEPGSLHLDMRALSRVAFLDARRRVIRVQAGMRWRDVQDAIDPHDLSVKIMQSFSNFTVGGAVSVNCHGRYVGLGPVVNSVRALQLVTADAQVLELSRSADGELFGAVIGGYGAFGAITEVELDLARNTRMERIAKRVPLEDYPRYFRESVLADPFMVMHNADLVPSGFDVPVAISWRATDKPPTEADRLIPRGGSYSTEKNAIWAVTELPGGASMRKALVDSSVLRKPAVVWRNHEASLDTAMLEPRTRSMSTYLLQEYFVPVDRFVPFARKMAAILKERRVNALNVSIRHSPADTVSLMRWAREEVFAFVLYYKQRSDAAASTESRAWTRELIDAALENGGRYYLPYRLDATREQFRRAYPQADAFAAVKTRVDPEKRFRNLLWDAYL